MRFELAVPCRQCVWQTPEKMPEIFVSPAVDADDDIPLPGGHIAKFVFQSAKAQILQHNSVLSMGIPSFLFLLFHLGPVFFTHIQAGADIGTPDDGGRPILGIDGVIGLVQLPGALLLLIRE